MIWLVSQPFHQKGETCERFQHLKMVSFFEWSARYVTALLVFIASWQSVWLSSRRKQHRLWLKIWLCSWRAGPCGPPRGNCDLAGVASLPPRGRWANLSLPTWKRGCWRNKKLPQLDPSASEPAVFGLLSIQQTLWIFIYYYSQYMSELHTRWRSQCWADTETETDGGEKKCQ